MRTMLQAIPVCTLQGLQMTFLFILGKVPKMVLTVAEENFIKLAEILLNVVPRLLRDLFIQKWNLKFPALLWNSDPASGLNLLNQIPIAARKKSACFPEFEKKILTGKEYDWDSTLLIFLLLYSEINLLDKCRKKNNRNPPLHISEEIDRIRCIRNSFFAQAPSMSCTATDFTQLTTELKCAARSAFGPASENAIDAIVTSAVETQLSEKLRQQPDKERKLNEEFKLWTEKIENELGGKHLRRFFCKRHHQDEYSKVLGTYRMISCSKPFGI